MSLQTVIVGRRTLLYEAGVLNGPLTLFLNERYDNPHSAADAARTLRIFHRWLTAFEIDLPARAVEGEGLRSVERKWLTELVYRPLEEIERMSTAMIRRFGSSSKALRAEDIEGAVDPNTARKRLITISGFLEWYRTNLLNEAIRSASVRDALEGRYTETGAQLTGWISGGTQGHHHQFRSLPNDRFLEVIRNLVLEPGLFLTADGAPSNNFLRDRAMALLAAEGLRPGAVGNIAIDDFRYRPGASEGYLEIKNNLARRGSPSTTATPTQKGISSTRQNYRHSVTMRLWGFTCFAIQEYIDSERAEMLAKTLQNQSKSFLFLASHGGPFHDRTSITAAFRSLRNALRRFGLLDAARGDPFVKGRHYEFTAYTLRHSAATLFYTANKHKPDVKDQMRTRFGWSATSSEPDRYANRAMSEGASVDLMEFHESLMQELVTRRANSKGKTWQ